MPKTTSWNIGIQLLRGIAATLVVFHHSFEESLSISAKIAPEWLIALGAGGVDIFFVISGFIIYSVTYGRDPQNPEPAPSFLLKRFIRIFPLYWICLLATLALWSSGYFYQSLHIDAHVLGSSFLLLPSSKLIIGVAWTLIYEMYFYYLFSITLYLRNARISVLTTTGFIGAGLLLSNLLPAGELKHFLSNPIALEFCFGLILSNMAAPQALAPTFVTSFGGLPALLVTVSSIKMRFDKSLLTRILLPIGDGSYSIYLTHPMMMILFALFDKVSFPNTHRLSHYLAVVVRGD